MEISSKVTVKNEPTEYDKKEMKTETDVKIENALNLEENLLLQPFVNDYTTFKIKKEIDENEEHKSETSEVNLQTNDFIIIKREKAYEEDDLAICKRLKTENQYEEVFCDTFDEDQTLQTVEEHFNNGEEQRTFSIHHSSKDEQLQQEDEEGNRGFRSLAPQNPQVGFEALPQNNITIHKCDYCSYSTTVKSRLNRHFNSHNEQRTKMNCQFCNKSFTTKSALDDHWLKQHKKLIENDITNFITSKIHKCKSCSFITTYKTLLKRHINSYHNNNYNNKQNRNCQFCNKLFTTKRVLDNHLLKHHKNEVKTDKDLITNKIYSCRTCSYQTTYKSLFNLHINSNHNKQKTEIVCEFCNNFFVSKRSLSNHLLEQHELNLTNIYQCDVCVYRTTFQFLLDIHVNSIHSEQKTKMKCQFCYKSFNSKRSLDDHTLKRHKEEIKSDMKNFISNRIYTCNKNNCSYETTRTDLLNMHYYSIHKEQITKVKCEFCKKSFTKQHALDDHLQKKHKQAVKSETGDSVNTQIQEKIKMNCQFCDKSFTTKRPLHDHILKQHENEIKHDVKRFITSKIHTCQICGTYETTRKDMLTEHINAMHKEQSIKINCEFCDKSFTKKQTLDFHFLKHHKQIIKNEISSETSQDLLDMHANFEQMLKMNCEFCDKSFNAKRPLHDHLLKQHRTEINDDINRFISSKIHACNICGTYETTHKTLLNKHINSVHNKEITKIDCQLCDESFTMKYLYNDHMLKEHNQKINGRIYKCKICAYKSTSKILLNSHINSIHNEEITKINCQFCEKSFTSKRSVDYHLLKEHEYEIKNDVNNFISSKIHTCQFCPFQTTRHDILKRHVNSSHNEQK